MNQPTYDLETSDDVLTFEFQSVGPVGTITKVVVYSPLPLLTGYYNLGFGDLNELGDLSDEAVTNNGDMSKVLATVVSTLFVFFTVYPAATVYFRGSTGLRTQLYQRIIQSNLTDFESFLLILGIKNGAEQLFDKQTQYDSFLIRKR